MTKLRVGTRGSQLALAQTNWVCDRLCEAHPPFSIEQVVIKTQGDLAPTEEFGPTWPVGAFVGALETALLERRIDLAVHSYKDLQTAPTEGLIVAATPQREVAHDALLTLGASQLSDLPAGARIGTGSPRRAAQMLTMGEYEIVPIRGNVPTRIEKLQRDNLDGIVLAAAGLRRLGVHWPHTIDLPLDRFLPAPAQGALAVQGREGSPALEHARLLDDPTTRRTVEAERTFLREIGAGCFTPIGALATATGDTILLHARLFTDDYRHFVDGVAVDPDPTVAGSRLATELRTKLTDSA